MPLFEDDGDHYEAGSPPPSLPRHSRSPEFHQPGFVRSSVSPDRAVRQASPEARDAVVAADRATNASTTKRRRQQRTTNPDGTPRVRKPRGLNVPYENLTLAQQRVRDQREAVKRATARERAIAWQARLQASHVPMSGTLLQQAQMLETPAASVEQPRRSASPVRQEEAPAHSPPPPLPMAGTDDALYAPLVLPGLDGDDEEDTNVPLPAMHRSPSPPAPGYTQPPPSYPHGEAPRGPHGPAYGEVSRRQAQSQRLPWSEDEVAALEDGLIHYPPQELNRWARILALHRDRFAPKRTSVHIKDKVRNERRRRHTLGIPMDQYME